MRGHAVAPDYEIVASASLQGPIGEIARFKAAVLDQILACLQRELQGLGQPGGQVGNHDGWSW